MGAATLLCAATLPANGRFPEAQKLIEDPRDANRLLLAGTYGLLVTGDRGQNWQYLCEQAFALEQIEGDPLLELLPDGALLSGITATLNRSADCGCAWSAVLAQPEPEYLRDVTVERSGARGVIALIRDLGKTPDVFTLSQSLDGGASWTKMGDLPATVEEAFTIDSAPSDASRLYASALTTDLKGALLVSTDRGATWETRVFDGANIDNQAYIAGVHPTNPDIVFVRTNGWDDQSYANDALFYTGDAGRTWSELIRKQGKLFGFALSPDGSKVLAGFGDPYQAASFTEPSELGLYAADTSQRTFTKIFFGAVSCLTWTSRGLYACNAEGVPDVGVDFTLGFRENADFTIDTPDPFTRLLELKNVRGPLGCAAAVCGDDWSMPSEFGPPVCERIGADCNGAPSAPTPCANAGTGGAGGAGGAGGPGGTGGGGAGSAGTAGAGGTSGALGSAGSGGATQGSGPGGAGAGAAAGDDGGGCGCRTPAAPTAFSALLTMLGLLPLWRLRRRYSR